MPLTDNQVEQQLTQRRLDIEGLKATNAALVNQVSDLNIKLSDLATQLSLALGAAASTNSQNVTDTYPLSGGILHKLKTTFTGIVTFASSVILSSLTASRPLKLDGSNKIISDKIDLAAPSTDVKNVLGVANGGTSLGTLTLDNVILGNGTSAPQFLAGITGALTLTPTTGSPGSASGSPSTSTFSLQYKDWTGTNQTLVVVTAVGGTFLTSVSGTFLTAVSLTTNAFTKGVRTT